jgi:hypothetical protein
MLGAVKPAETKFASLAQLIRLMNIDVDIGTAEPLNAAGSSKLERLETKSVIGATQERHHE